MKKIILILMLGLFFACSGFPEQEEFATPEAQQEVLETDGTRAECAHFWRQSGLYKRDCSRCGAVEESDPRDDEDPEEPEYPDDPNYPEEPDPEGLQLRFTADAGSSINLIKIYDDGKDFDYEIVVDGRSHTRTITVECNYMHVDLEEFDCYFNCTNTSLRYKDNRYIYTYTFTFPANNTGSLRTSALAWHFMVRGVEGDYIAALKVVQLPE